MLYRIEKFGGLVLRAVDGMNTQQWIVISALAIVLGALMLRGYGSRTSY